MTKRVLVLGNNSVDTNDMTTSLAEQDNTCNHGLLDPDNILESGYYHTSLADIPAGVIINLAPQFDKIVLLDQPFNTWSSSKIFLSTYKLMLELERKGFVTEYKNNQNIKALQYWINLFETNKSFCAYPWIVYNVENGKLRTCARDMTFVKKENLLSNWQFDKDFNQIRQKMKQGEKLSQHCQTCYSYEEQGATGYRKHDSLDWIMELGFTDIKDFDKITNPYYYELRLSNKCNLMCRMCKPSDSHLIKKEFKKHPELYSFGQNSADDWHYSSIDTIDIHTLTDKHQVYLTGGEPTIMQEVFKFMQNCIDQKKTNFKFTLGTNAEKLSNRFLELASHFEQMHFSVSIDGYGLINDYIRFKSTFQHIIDNSHTLINQGHKITWNHVPTIWGIHKTHLLFEYLSEHFPMVHLYFQWNRLDLTSAFKSPLITETLESLERCKQTVLYYNDGKDCRTGVDAVYEHYKQASIDLDHLKKFFKYNDSMDQARNIKLSDYIPELDACRNLLK